MLIFFIHKFNDIDHMVPIIYKIANDTNEKIAIFSMNPFYDIYNDYRLQFLLKKYDVTLNYLYMVYKPSFFYKILGLLICSNYYDPMSNNLINYFKSFISRIFRKLFYVFNIDFSKLAMKWYPEKWVMGLYDYLKRPRRQDMTDDNIKYIENGSVYMFTNDIYHKIKNRLGGKIGYYIFPQEYSFEIDSMNDWINLEQIAKQINN